MMMICASGRPRNLFGRVRLQVSSVRSTDPPEAVAANWQCAQPMGGSRLRSEPKYRISFFQASGSAGVGTACQSV
jgi:hypothetical protein